MKILILPGDGIGPEIVGQAVRVLEKFKAEGVPIELSHGLLGGAAHDAHGHPYPEVTQQQARAADAILLGCVGGPQYDTLPRAVRPEQGLLGIRKDLKLFANLRPAMLYPELAASSSLKPEVVAGLDIMIIRELTGYAKSEVERIAHVGFRTAMKRNKKLCSVDKANVLDTSILWREVVTEIGKQYPEVQLSHMYVDNAAMQLVRAPKQFDVIVTGNIFGDILSDEASMLAGSIGMLPSASLDASNKGLYEPIHGSAPDIAGQNKANPIATVLSLAMMMRYSFSREDLAQRIETGVRKVLASGARTGDIALPGEAVIGTKAMGDALVAAV
ncbi:3-isopropylmalate dehydrogenase [Casimicrobium huifangae]|uniref:3-isopropylmalate dehydrogenase n=1 Tax=Casimicrobium huifangae TaxID=2591109 RepID=UPI003784E5CC